MRVPALDLFNTFRLFDHFDKNNLRHRDDTIDEEGIKVELPGVKPSDVDVSVEGRTLKISGKSRHGKEFSYVYSLKHGVDDSAITATMKDGLLSVSLPKKQESSTRKIQVSG